MHPHHSHILSEIKRLSGKPTQHTFLHSYLGNTHLRYPIHAPTMRRIAKDWMKANRSMDAKVLSEMLTSLVAGESSTEKCMAGVLLDYSTKDQRRFPPVLFDQWLDHLHGWAEVDTLCTGTYTITEIPGQWKEWKKLLAAFSKSKNINKRRASIVLLCSPLRQEENDDLVQLAFQNVSRLQSERAILITKAISWVLRSAVKYHGGL